MHFGYSSNVLENVKAKKKAKADPLISREKKMPSVLPVIMVGKTLNV